MLKIIPLFINHSGCPYKCVFCDQNKITGRRPIDLETAREQIISDLQKIKKSGKSYETIILAFYGGTFSGLTFKEMEGYSSLLGEFPEIGYIRISTRPDMIDTTILDFLYGKGVREIELGVQSLNNKVLELSSRGYTEDIVYRAASLIKNYGFKMGFQLMAGLPGQTENSFFSTVEKTVDQRPDMVRVYPTVVFKGTALADMLQNSTYQPLTIEEGVEQTARAVARFREEGIEVIRIGLHSVTDEENILGGCYHPQFRYMVESRIIRNNIEEFLMSMIGKDGSPAGDDGTRSPVKLVIDKKYINYFKGFKNSNVEYFRAKGWELKSEFSDNMQKSVIIREKSYSLVGA
ncbi:MAG: radical SAM protein, partial [Actinomycetia bacterium]|nr:radical SAM protein [Actinomycetes bacterium]